MNGLTHEQRCKVAARIKRQRKADGAAVSFSWHAHGSTVKRFGPGTVFKATVSGDPSPLEFLVYLPTPHNSRATAKRILAAELENELHNIPRAKVEPFTAGDGV